MSLMKKPKMLVGLGEERVDKAEVELAMHVVSEGNKVVTKFMCF